LVRQATGELNEIVSALKLAGAKEDTAAADGEFKQL
jgi:hypothetical protein